MNQETKKLFSKFNQTRVLAVFLYIISPLMYVQIPTQISVEVTKPEFFNIIISMLLIYGALAPFVLVVIKKAIILAYHKRKMGIKSPEGAWSKYFIVQAGVIHAIFVYGMMMFFLSGDIQKMLYFYPIGIVWSYIGWPTRKRYENFISQIEQQ